MLLALAHMAPLQHGILIGNVLRAIQRLHGEIFFMVRIIRTLNGENAVEGNLIDAQLSLAADADDIGLFPVHPVLPQELIVAVTVAGFQKDQRPALFFPASIMYLLRLAPQKPL